MQRVSFEEIVERLAAQDPRYRPEAYGFLREALDYTQKKFAAERVARGGGERAEASAGDEAAEDQERHHVTGQQLVEGIRDYAVREFGPMSMLVLSEWGLTRCEDFGEIVFNLIDAQVLRKTEKDSREDFRGGYTFEDAFVKPFLPPSLLARRASDPAGHQS